MVKILFVCHGNICRSPMAEFVMKQKVTALGLQDEFEIASAATSTEEIGNPVYPPVRQLLQAHGIDCSGKTARQITQQDYTHWDLLIGMDHYNMINMRRIYRNDPKGKLRLMCYPREVADPWYSGDFETTWNDVCEGCDRLIREFFPSVLK